MAKLKIHPSNVTYLTICLLSLVAFFLVGIYPNLSALQEMDAEITTLHQKVQTQELLFPVYKRLIKEVIQKVPTKLSVPEKNKISPNDLVRINEMLNKLAAESEVTFSRAIPDASNYLEDKGYLTMKVDFIGDFFNLRRLLLSICQLPYLESIDQMRIETLQQQKRMSFKLKIAQQ